MSYGKLRQNISQTNITCVGLHNDLTSGYPFYN